jgi:hypothetical protein
MQVHGFIRRASAAVALASAVGAAFGAHEAAGAATPSPFWSGLARINVLCLVRTEAGVDESRLTPRICSSVRDIAARNAPVPVGIIAPGDPAILSPDSVTLLVHASVQGDERGRLIAFHIRPYRNSTDQLIFAAAPRAARLADSAAADKGLEAALSAALSETLPWLGAAAGPRSIH